MVCKLCYTQHTVESLQHDPHQCKCKKSGEKTIDARFCALGSLVIPKFPQDLRHQCWYDLETTSEDGIMKVVAICAFYEGI